MKLIKIIEDLKVIRNETRQRISDNIIFEQAVKIYLSGKIQESKEKNIDRINNKVKPKPTDKQIYFLKKHKVKNIERLSKKEASELISKLKNGEI